MTPYRLIIIASFGCLLASGCASGPKPVHQRGWIGGTCLEADTSFFKAQCANYFEHGAGVIPALPEAIRDTGEDALFVSRVFDRTPLKAADIREGDLILSIDGEPVNGLTHFRKTIDGASPGDGLTVEIFRNGQRIHKQVTVGMETYQNSRAFSLGFRLSSTLNPIPLPGFNLLGLLSFETNKTRLELHSPEFQYVDATFPKGDNSDPIAEKDPACFEGWDAWCLIFGFSGKKIILDQRLSGDTNPQS
ncbi:hypothetical protein JCM14469_12220 [Desulfatiferula olefinivorans]